MTGAGILRMRCQDLRCKVGDLAVFLQDRDRSHGGMRKNRRKIRRFQLPEVSRTGGRDTAPLAARALASDARRLACRGGL